MTAVDTTWPGPGHRRPPAFIDQPTVAAQPVVAVPAPAVGSAPADRPWTWTATDLLILPVALWLAEGPGQRRRTRNAVTRRGTSYRPGSTR